MKRRQPHSHCSPSAPIEIIQPLMESPRNDGLLIPCKAAGCSWETLRAIVECKASSGEEKKDIEKLKTVFAKLSRSNAQSLLRLWQIRQTGLSDR